MAMIRLFEIPPAGGLPSASPFCVKLEAYMRMAGLAYESVLLANPAKAPKGKLPYIEDGPKTVADSGLIIEYLKKEYGDPLDEKLTAGQWSVAHAFRRLLEESLYFAIVYSRWIDPVGWAVLKPELVRMLPPVARWFVPGLARSSVRKSLHQQGIARHAPDEVYALGDADLSAIATFLADKPYMMGDSPTSLDASAYGMIASIVTMGIESRLKSHARSHENLIAYCDRMREAYFSDA